MTRRETHVCLPDADYTSTIAALATLLTGIDKELTAAKKVDADMRADALFRIQMMLDGGAQELGKDLVALPCVSQPAPLDRTIL